MSKISCPASEGAGTCTAPIGTDSVVYSLSSHLGMLL